MMMDSEAGVGLSSGKEGDEPQPAKRTKVRSAPRTTFDPDLSANDATHYVRTCLSTKLTKIGFGEGSVLPLAPLLALSQFVFENGENGPFVRWTCPIIRDQALTLAA